MTLLALMYHRASSGRHGNSPEMLDAHFAVLAQQCWCVIPGEPLHAVKINICLTFDDAYADFYAVVFPLLRKHGLRAMLAVPVLSIGETVDLPLTTRLEACTARLTEATPNAYCTWSELSEMAASGLIVIASHGFSHIRLDDPNADLVREITVSRAILAARIGTVCDSFVLPYGRFSAKSIKFAKQHHRYVFRIGSADNGGWDGRMIYRVDADEMSSPTELLSRRRLVAYRLRRQWNRLRSR